MSGSSESLQSSVQNSFQLVPEGQWLVHSMEDDEDACRAFGTVDLMSCIGVYVQVTKEHFFLAHILDDFTCKKGEDGLLKFGGEHTKNLRKVLIEERDEDKVKKMKINLGKNLDVLVEQGKAHNLWLHYALNRGKTFPQKLIFPRASSIQRV